LTLIDIDELLLPYLAEHPPVHILVAGAVGFKPRAKRAPSGLTRGPQSAGDDPVSQHGASLGEAMAVLGTGDVHAGMRQPVILDFGRLKAAAANRS
jgi:hypothetical protein